MLGCADDGGCTNEDGGWGGSEEEVEAKAREEEIRLLRRWMVREERLESVVEDREIGKFGVARDQLISGAGRTRQAFPKSKCHNHAAARKEDARSGTRNRGRIYDEHQFTYRH